MARIRASIGLIALTALLVSVVVAGGVRPASAAPVPAPLNYACTSKASGLMRYVSSPAKCVKTENAVTIAAGPIYVCVYLNFFVRQVPALKNCTPSSTYAKALTLPPASAPVYFCALAHTGSLSYASSPSQCTGIQTPVVVAVAHQAPVLANLEPGTQQYYAATPGVQITSDLTVSSAHAASLTSATVTIGSGLVPADDSLSFANAGGITGSYAAGTGVLTLTGTASLAAYQAALRSVTYADSDALTAAGTRTISFQVNDGSATGNLSNVVSRTIAVNTNSLPTAANISASTDKNTAIDVNVLSSATAPNGETLSVAATGTTGTKGSVSINGDGTIHYDPNGQFQSLPAGQSTTDSFTYTVYDGYETSTAATVTVTINGVNDAPVISDIESTPLSYQAQGSSAQITGTATLSDDDDATMGGATATITSGFSSGSDVLSFTNAHGITGSYNSSTGGLTLSGSASTADYQAALRSVQFATSDNSASPAARAVSFTVTDSGGASSVAVTRTIDVSQAVPTAANVSASTDKNTAIDIDVLATATAPAGDTLSVASVGTTSTKGSVSINGNGTIHYDPNGKFQSLTASQSATDTFTYAVSDGSQTSSSATVTVTVTGVSDAPVISNIESTPLSYQAQGPPVQITTTATLSDDDATTMAAATVAVTSGFSSGADSLSFTNANGITGSYDSATGVLALSGSASTADYQAALRSVQFATSDSSTSPAVRTVSFTVIDSAAATSAAVTRAIDVSQAAAQAPTAVGHSYTAVGNTPLGVGTSPTGPAATVSGTVLTGDTDPNPSATLSVTANTQPAHGSVTMNPDGTFTYVPAAGYTGADSFQYTIDGSNDTGHTATATATVSITVGTLVWYVNDALSAAGNGEASTPFNTLAAATSAAGANSIVFLYQGNASYTGGATMASGEDLFGQPHGLVVGGYALVAAGGSAPAITNSGGAGLTLAENADVEGINVSGPSGNGIAATGVNDATVGGSTAVAISGAGGNGIAISGGSGTLDFAGTSVTGSTGHSLSVASRTGGTASFGGNITDHSTGITLTGNNGAIINLSGTLSISTGTNTAFSATGGGTISASGAGSTLATTTGTALTVQNTTIASGGLTFQAVSSNGAADGISLTSTGTSGGLLVTGTGSGGSGGTIQNSTGAGIALSATTAPSFTDMVIEHSAADGISGSQVNGLTLAGSAVSGNGTQAGVSGENNDGLDFSPNGTGSPDGLTGTVSITGSTITGSADNNAVISDTSGTLNLTVTGSTFSADNASTGNDGLHVDADGSTNATVSVTSSTFTNNAGDHFQFSTDSASTGTDSVTFSGNTLTSTVAGILGGGVVISPYGNSHTTITVGSNNIQSSVFTGIAIDEDGSAGTLSGTVSGNTIGVAATANSGSQGNDIGIFAEGSGTETLAITGNKLTQYANEAGINFLDREGSPAMNLTITGNTIADPGSFGSWGLLGDAGAQSGDSGQVCAAISGNSMTGSGQISQGGADFELDQEFGGTIRLPGYTGGSSDTNAVVGFVRGNNNGSGTPNGIVTVSGSGGFTGGASCPAP